MDGLSPGDTFTWFYVNFGMKNLCSDWLFSYQLLGRMDGRSPIFSPPKVRILLGRLLSPELLVGNNSLGQSLRLWGNCCTPCPREWTGRRILSLPPHCCPHRWNSTMDMNLEMTAYLIIQFVNFSRFISLKHIRNRAAAGDGYKWVHVYFVYLAKVLCHLKS